MTSDGVCASLAQVLQERRWLMTTAESCTGGLIAAACTALSGSSAWFERGFVTYSNTAKTEMLGVPEALIAQHGAVSGAVALAMAQGAIKHSRAHVSVAVTGVAGPTGGSVDKPVGTVWIAWQVNGHVENALHHFSGNRLQVRQAAVQQALQGLLERLGCAE